MVGIIKARLAGPYLVSLSEEEGLVCLLTVGIVEGGANVLITHCVRDGMVSGWG